MNVETLRDHDGGAAWRTFAIIAAVALLVFCVILFMVERGETAGFDRAILLSLRVPGDLGRPVGSHSVAETMRDCTALGGTAFRYFLMFGVIGYLLFDRRWRDAVTLLGIAIGGQIISTGLKHLVDRPRPDLVPHLSYVSSASFPSGHAMGSTVLTLTLALLVARHHPRFALKVWLLALAVFTAILVGVSRVYLGVHWPTDVLAGWSLGVAWAMLCWAMLEWRDRDRRLPAPENFT